MASRTDGSNYYLHYDGRRSYQCPYVDAKYASTELTANTCPLPGRQQCNAGKRFPLGGADRLWSVALLLQNIQMESVSATLGLQSLNTSIQAAIIGLILIILLWFSIIACWAWLRHFLIFFAVVFVDIISWSHLNLTLSGIAGIILTLGMAVIAIS